MDDAEALEDEDADGEDDELVDEEVPVLTQNPNQQSWDDI